MAVLCASLGSALTSLPGATDRFTRSDSVLSGGFGILRESGSGPCTTRGRIRAVPDSRLSRIRSPQVLDDLAAEIVENHHHVEMADFRLAAEALAHAPPERFVMGAFGGFA